MIIVTSSAAHIRDISSVGSRRIRKMTQDAVSGACRKARESGATPVTMVDDLTIHSVGPWIDSFAKCLARSARREGISVIGGEIAQMPDTYRTGYVGVWVTVVSLKPPPSAEEEYGR